MTALAVIGATNIFGTWICGVLGGRLRGKHVLAVLYLMRAVATLVYVGTPITVASTHPRPAARRTRAVAALRRTWLVAVVAEGALLLLLALGWGLGEYGGPEAAACLAAGPLPCPFHLWR